MLPYLSYVAVGVLAGTLSGLLGLGGGIVLVPAMVYLYGMTQHQAQGTTLALMVPPIGILAAWRYYQEGNVNLSMAAFICLGFVAGGWLGANLAAPVPDATLRKVFGAALVVTAIRMMMS